MEISKERDNVGKGIHVRLILGTDSICCNVWLVNHFCSNVWSKLHLRRKRGDIWMVIYFWSTV